tara:strand:+ start:5894 stop:6208 length:315 start_codon:yes stop_codon:yes gene_type:complete
MQVLGLDEIECFLAGCGDPHACEALKAFVFELKHRNWPDVGALVNDYPQAELSELPTVSFRLSNNTVLVQGLVHFESGVLLLKKCIEHRNRRPNSGDHTEWEAA